MKTCKEMRYENAKSLAVSGPAKFAEVLAISSQQANAIIGPNPKRNIGDAQARLIEELFGQEVGWLDHDHSYDDAVDKTSIRGHKVPLSDEADQLISCVTRLDGLGIAARELFLEHRRMLAVAVSFARAQYSKQAHDYLAQAEEILASHERSEETINDHERKRAV